MKRKTRAVGRPSKYKTEFCEMLIEHGKTGGSFRSFAAVCDVSIETIYQWCEKHKEFIDAKKRAKAYLYKWYEDLARAGMTGNLTRVAERQFDQEGNVTKEIRVPTNFNVTAWIFSMKNIFDWRDKKELSGNKDAPLIMTATDIVKQAVKDAKKLNKK